MKSAQEVIESYKVEISKINEGLKRNIYPIPEILEKRKKIFEQEILKLEENLGGKKDGDTI